MEESNERASGVLCDTMKVAEAISEACDMFERLGLNLCEAQAVCSSLHEGIMHQIDCRAREIAGSM